LEIAVTITRLLFLAFVSPDSLPSVWSPNPDWSAGFWDGSPLPVRRPPDEVLEPPEPSEPPDAPPPELLPDPPPCPAGFAVPYSAKVENPGAVQVTVLASLSTAQASSALQPLPLLQR